MRTLAMKPLFTLIALLGLSACYEDTDVTLHEPGVYKGNKDEHALTAEERAEVLVKRFNQVQTDR
jgi:hypothetical protein